MLRLNQLEDYTVRLEISRKIILYRVAFTAKQRLSDQHSEEELCRSMKAAKISSEPRIEPAVARSPALFRNVTEEIVDTIRDLVEIESPSDNKPAVDRIAAFLAAKFEALGGRTRLHRTADFGDNLQIDFAGRKQRASRFCCSATTTRSIPSARWPACPAKSQNGLLHGPGVLDMKSGIALMLHAIAALQAWHGELPRPVTVFLVSDEEVGSHSSRKDY